MLTSSLKGIIADAIYLVHLALLVIIYVGSFAFPPSILRYQLFLVPLIIVDWNIDGKCILTVLEDYFRQQEQVEEFFRPLIEKVTGTKISVDYANRINYLSLTFSWLVSYVRLLRYC